MRRLLLYAAMIGLVACGSTDPSGEVSGAYSLATVNGQPPPFRTTAANVTASLNSGLLIISPKGEFSIATSGTQTIGTQPPSPVAEIVNGTWSASGSTLTMLSYQPPMVLTASVAGGVLTYTDGGRTYVYRKS